MSQPYSFLQEICIILGFGGQIWRDRISMGRYSQWGRNSAREDINLEEGKEIDLVDLLHAVCGGSWEPNSLFSIVFWRCSQPHLLFFYIFPDLLFYCNEVKYLINKTRSEFVAISCCHFQLLHCVEDHFLSCKLCYAIKLKTKPQHKPKKATDANCLTNRINQKT
jgi:hypothetical protein